MFSTLFGLLVCAFIFEFFFLEKALIFELLTAPEKGRYKLYLLSKKTNQPYDSRGVWEYVDESNESIQSLDEQTFPWYGAFWLITDFPGLKVKLPTKDTLVPLTGPSLSRIVTNNEGGLYGIHNTDEHGFHNPTGLYDNKIKIAIVGDSFAEGSSVNSGEDSVSHIRKVYPESINFGKAGQGPLSTLAVIREYVEVVKPEIVLWYFYEGNDLLDIKMERTVYKGSALGDYFLKYLDSEFRQGLYFRQKEIDDYIRYTFWPNFVHSTRWEPTSPLNRSANTALTKIKKNIKEIPIREKLLLRATIDYLKRNYQSILDDLQKALKKVTETTKSKKSLIMPRDWKLFLEVFKLAKKGIEANGGKLIFVYIPEYERVKLRDSKQFFTQTHSSNKQKVISLISNMNIPVIDTTKDLIMHEDPLSLYFFRSHGHFNVEGNKFIAKIILGNLDKITESD